MDTGHLLNPTDWLVCTSRALLAVQCDASDLFIC